MQYNISYLRIWQVSYPIILGSVAQNIINVTDTAFLGRVGQVELGASALGGLFYLVFIMLALGFGTGTQIIIARRFGEAKNHEIGKTFDHALYFMIPLAIISFSILYFFSPLILRPIVSSDSIYKGTLEFLDYRVFGIIFAFGQIQFRSFYIGITSTKVITWSTLVLAGVNVLFGYLLIFGKFGFPKMGIGGAGLASTIAEACAFLYLMIYTWGRHYKKKFELFSFLNFDKSLFVRNFKIAGPIMIQNFLSLGVWFAFFLFVEKLGEQSLAISNIIRSVYVVLMIPIWGFAAAANSLVSYLIGLKQTDQVFLLIRRIITLSFCGVLGFVLLSLAFPSQIISVYTNDIQLIKASIPVLHVVNIGALALSVGFVLFNGVIGTGKTMVSFAIEVSVLSVYLTFVYVSINFFHATVVEVWIAELVYGLFLITFSLLYLKKGNWQGNKV
ncbi:MAG: MATE family efflux transporter [Bacteroidales bacterium]|nr:MATE family efflux transporter [Bacteroidales bacterium]